MNLPSVGVPWLGLAAWLGVSMASSLVDSTENLSRLTAVFAELAPLPPCNSVWVDSFITSKVQAAIGLHRAHHSTAPGVQVELMHSTAVLLLQALHPFPSLDIQSLVLSSFSYVNRDQV